MSLYKVRAFHALVNSFILQGVLRSRGTRCWLMIFTSIHHYSPLFTTIHQYSPYSPLFTIIHPCSPLFTIIHHYSPSFTIIHHYSPLFTYSRLFTIKDLHHYSLKYCKLEKQLLRVFLHGVIQPPAKLKVSVPQGALQGAL